MLFYSMWMTDILFLSLFIHSSLFFLPVLLKYKRLLEEFAKPSNEEEIASQLDRCIQEELRKEEASQTHYNQHRSILNKPLPVYFRGEAVLCGGFFHPSLDLANMRTNVSTLEEVKDQVASQHRQNNPGQNAALLAVYQARLVGKTQLCINLSRYYPVAMLRWNKEVDVDMDGQSSAFPFQRLLLEIANLLRKEASNNPTIFGELSVLFYLNQWIVQLWILAHLEFFSLFYKHSK